MAGDLEPVLGMTASGFRLLLQDERVLWQGRSKNLADVIGRSYRIQVGPNERGDTWILAVMPATAANDGSEHPDVAQDQVEF